jgi:undecaprenyl-diphosphatase
MSPGNSARLNIAHAVALGALHGPAELLPISSSGHVAVVPWLLRWDYADLDGEVRKSFEVALHAGTAAALLLTLRDEVGEAVHGLDPRRLTLIAGSFAPPAVAGYALERPIESRLGTPATVATGLLAGAALMAWADRFPQSRSHEDADWRDAVSLGFAQALALIPGVSRNGATLAVARLRGFAREDANRLSRHVALPVITGATALKAFRLSRRGFPAGTAAPFAAGTVAAFVSTLGSTWLIRQVERDRSLLPYALYRAGLAGLILRRVTRSGRCRRMDR